MSSSIAGIIIGGVIPAIVFGIYGTMQKACMRAGLGIGPFFIVLGLTSALFGLGYNWLAPGGSVTLAGAISAVAFSAFWVLGIGLILLAVNRFGASISQLAPLYNGSTLVTVVLGLLIFAEWKEVHATPLLLGTLLIVAGTVFVARA